MAILAFILPLLVIIALTNGLNPPQPPSQGAFFTNKYRNLFEEMGYSNDAIQAKIQSIFQTIFYGDSKNNALYYPVGNDMAYIWDVADNDVRTEGMSYGMMICVQLDKQKEFDSLYKWAITYMRHNEASDPRYGYFSWHCKTNGDVIDQNSASDGETYFATALLFAAARWGNSSNFDYYKEANDLLATMLDKEINGPVQSVTNMFNSENHQVVFTPYAGAATYTDPSYHLPSFYYVWSKYAAQNQSFWSETVGAARTFFHEAANANTGLMPDYAKFTGQSHGGTHFSFDAWRCAMNWAMDYAWFANDKQQIDLSNKLLDFFISKGIKTYGNQFSLDGNQISGDHSPGLVAMNAVAGLSATTNNTWQFVEALWEQPIPSGQYRYYDGMLYFLGMLHVSGNFKAYKIQ